MKKDSERFREQQIPIPRAQKFGINAISFNHPDMKHWLDVFKDVGLEHLHRATNLTVFGAPDDIWLVDNASLSVIDGKATHSNKTMPESLFWPENKKQVELYSWLLSHQGLYYPVSQTAYFVRFNTDKDQNSFEDNTLRFKDEIVPHVCNYDWIEPTLVALKACLMQKKLPESNPSCPHCQYRDAISKIGKRKKKKK